MSQAVFVKTMVKLWIASVTIKSKLSTGIRDRYYCPMQQWRLFEKKLGNELVENRYFEDAH